MILSQNYKISKIKPGLKNVDGFFNLGCIHTKKIIFKVNVL